MAVDSDSKASIRRAVFAARGIDVVHVLTMLSLAVSGAIYVQRSIQAVEQRVAVQEGASAHLRELFDRADATRRDADREQLERLKEIEAKLDRLAERVNTLRLGR